MLISETYFIDWSGGEYEVLCDIRANLVPDGIGAFEIWGQNCFDGRTNWEFELEDFSVIEETTTKQIPQITKQQHQEIWDIVADKIDPEELIPKIN